VAAEDINTNELKMLRSKVLSAHPWIQSNVNRTLARIRRALGEDVWGKVTHAAEEVRTTKDMAPWYGVVDPLFETINKIEKAQKLAAQVAFEKKAEAAQQEMEKIKQEEIASRMVTNNIIRVSSASASKVVKRIRREG
jgi:flagellar basal body-associated protein FliL